MAAYSLIVKINYVCYTGGETGLLCVGDAAATSTTNYMHLLEMPEVSCDGWRKQLLNCLLQSDCVRKEGHSPRECVEAKMPGVKCPEECVAYRIGLMKCKFSQVDARTRFRGKKEFPKDEE